MIRKRVIFSGIDSPHQRKKKFFRKLAFSPDFSYFPIIRIRPL